MEPTQRYRITVACADNGRRAALDFLEAWLDRPELCRLVEQGGGTWPASGDPSQRLQILHDFSERWDFRRGAERLQIGQPNADIDADVVMSSAAGLGMTTALSPSDGQYDHAVVLGGTALANLNRLRRLHDLIDGGLDVGRVAALTALREISPSEVDLARERPQLSHLVDEA